MIVILYVLIMQLHFPVAGRTTLPLRPEDYRRFLPEQARPGMQAAFPPSHQFSQPSDSRGDKSSQVVRQASKKEHSFVGLPHKDGKKREKLNNRSRSTDTELRPGRGGLGWRQEESRAPSQVSSQGKQSNSDQQWILKEREDLKSMPTVILSDQFNDKSRKINRNDKNRSSFGMILKDKFQKNPNMYFPDTRNVSTKEKKVEKHSKQDSLSDTDTLIHNMSEGSFEKNSSLSGGRSVGSGSGSRSSGGSHDSLHGTPRMVRRSESITTPSQPSPTSLLLPTNPSVILNKKTIRNYAPPESTNMLRHLEGTRKGKEEAARRQETGTTARETPERKSSMDELIDDFHRNLPPPARPTESSLPFSDGDSLFSSHAEHSLTLTSEQKGRSAGGPRRGGTVTSQTSLASSAASFDYHSVNSIDKTGRGGAGRRSGEPHLPSLIEQESRPQGVRVPPEGASAESPKHSVSRKEDKEAAVAAVADLIKSSENDDELLTLRKLISEGRISGLSEAPPPFTPPTPPTAKSEPRPAQPVQRQYTQATKSGDRPRKNREAPKPPGQEFKTPPHSADIKFIGGRRINSVENINNDQSTPSRRAAKREPKSEGVQRSTSMHMPRGN